MSSRGKRVGNTKPRAGVGGKGADNNNDLTSDENDAPSASSPKRLKGRARETEAARAAAEEVAALEADDDANQVKKKTTKPPEKDAPTNNKSSVTERQKAVEQNRLETEAAQKRADAEKESLRLAEENKKLRLMLQRKKDPTPSTPSSSRSKPPRSNSARREKKVSRYFALFTFG